MSVDRGFWARRKANVEAEEAAERAALEAEAIAAEQAVLEEKSDDEILAELDLPEPESLSEGDDFTAFMQKAVPDRIRRRALRVLWRSNPVLANVDMLVDYGEDFTDSAMIIENMQTAYQVGKGMLKHVEEMARQAAEEEAAEDEPLVAEAAEPELEDAEDYDEGRIEPEAQDMAFAGQATPDHAAEVPVSDDEPDAALPPRRMKFRVEESA